MALFRKNPEYGDPALPKDDRGTGSLDGYDYNLAPRKHDHTMRLADATPHQDEIAALAEEHPELLTTATPARSLDQERVDAPIEVRLFAGRRVSGVIGVVPRGLEGVYDEAVRRLDGRGDKPRIPVSLVQTRKGWRVDLVIGASR